MVKDTSHISSVSFVCINENSKLRWDSKLWRYYDSRLRGAYGLNPYAVEIIRMCDGTRSLRGIVAEVARRQLLGTSTEAEVISLFIAGLARLGVVHVLEKPAPLPVTLEELHCSSHAPFFVQVHPTLACNNHCIICNTAQLYAKTAQLSLSEFNAFFEYLADQGVFGVRISGGEPFARRDIVDIVESAVSHGLDVFISTNGRLVTENVASKLRRLISHVHVTIFSPIPSDHEAITQIKSSFRQTIATVHLLKRLGFTVTTGTVLTKHLIRNLDAMIDFCLDLGVDRLRIMNLLPFGLSEAILQNVGVEPDDWQSVNKQIRHLVTEYRDRLEFSYETRLIPPITEALTYCFQECDASVNQLFVDANGDIYPCYTSVERSTPMGNARQALRQQLPLFAAMKIRQLVTICPYAMICPVVQCSRIETDKPAFYPGPECPILPPSIDWACIWGRQRSTLR